MKSQVSLNSSYYNFENNQKQIKHLRRSIEKRRSLSNSSIGRGKSLNSEKSSKCYLPASGKSRRGDLTAEAKNREVQPPSFMNYN